MAGVDPVLGSGLGVVVLVVGLVILVRRAGSGRRSRIRAEEVDIPRGRTRR